VVLWYQNANPLTDIDNMRAIEAVIVNGKYLSREELDEMLALVKSQILVRSALGVAATMRWLVPEMAEQLA
jgi:predicted hydrolase (HD superfamily)